MIVVAIIGILAAVALPAYTNYTTRAMVSEGISVAQGFKTAVAEYRAVTGDWPANLAAIGMADVADGAVASVGVDSSNGAITVTYANVGALTGDPTVIFLPAVGAGAITWSCSTGSMSDDYLPEDCK